MIIKCIFYLNFRSKLKSTETLSKTFKYNPLINMYKKTKNKM